MDSTLASDLRGVAELYAWAEAVARIDLDAMLERSELPTGRQLESLISFMRNKAAPGGVDLNSLATVATKALSIRTFLRWAADPANQGRSRRKTVPQLAEEHAMVSTLFQPLGRLAARSQRIRPLLPNELERIDALCGPVRNQEGRIILPCRFHGHNPFRPETRLRNWLMVTLALQCGHRRGELLKTRLDDIPRSTDVGMKVLRRPHDPTDSRRYKLRAKTAERVLPISHGIRIGLRAYLTLPHPQGRPNGRSPYLIVAIGGKPLSISAADGIVKVIAQHTQIEDLSWHSFRHTWAEGLPMASLTGTRKIRHSRFSVSSAAGSQVRQFPCTTFRTHCASEVSSFFEIGIAVCILIRRKRMRGRVPDEDPSLSAIPEANTKLVIVSTGTPASMLSRSSRSVVRRQWRSAA
jgi:integrase